MPSVACRWTVEFLRDLQGQKCSSECARLALSSLIEISLEAANENLVSPNNRLMSVVLPDCTQERVRE